MTENATNADEAVEAQADALETGTTVVATAISDPEPHKDAPTQTADAEPAGDGSDVELRKIKSGIYTVWLGDTEHARRIGSVARVAEGEWLAYSVTGHAGKEKHATRQAAAEALAANRRK